MLQTGKYFNRDLSWLSFNHRVLMEATEETLPLYERIKFLAIYASNLEEFFKVRVASLQGLLTLSKENPIDPKAKGILTQILIEVERQQEEFGQIYREQILPALAQEGIHLIQGSPQHEVHRAFVQRHFQEEIQAFLHPELLRKNKINHFLREGALYLAVKLRNRPRNYQILTPAEQQALSRKKRIRYALIQIPTHYFPRFIELPRVDDSYYFMFLEDIIRENLDQMFHGYEVLCSHSIKLNRNADLLIEDEFKGNLVDIIRSSLKKRQIGVPARFLYDQNMPKPMLKYLRDTFGILKLELSKGATYHSFQDFFRFPNPVAPRLERIPTPPLPHPELARYANLFEAIRERDWMLHFPYQSYEYVLRFFDQAADDPLVSQIHTTQYRVASDSAIVQALIRAAQNGKKVSVFVEIKARFDEANNLHFAREMERAGIDIYYSFPGLKVHAKVALVIREEEEGARGYAFLSTGNFNEKTARIYGDHGLLTSDQSMTKELLNVINYLHDPSMTPTFDKLLVAQFNMRERFEAMIAQEIANHQAGKPANILVKVNNLEDKRMIKQLYAASQAGVQVDLIVRGICRLRPGVEGLSEQIRVIRIVDQFLEHARVFVFHQEGKNSMYMGSADWMSRNLNRRIEVGFPIEDERLKAEVMQILNFQLADNVKAVSISSQLDNDRIPTTGPAIRSQAEIYRWIKAQSGNRILEMEEG
ncbi:MAG: polyphosphate kinase 1 [Bacteroidota bacterium]